MSLSPGASEAPSDTPARRIGRLAGRLIHPTETLARRMGCGAAHLVRMATTRALPPLWVRVFIWPQVIFLLVPFPPVLHGLLGGGTVSMLGMSFDGRTGPALCVLLLELLTLWSGLTALAFLMRWRWAYHFAAAFGIVGLSVGVAGLVTNAGGPWSRPVRAVVLHGLLVCFVVHVMRHRHAWKEQAARRRTLRPHRRVTRARPAYTEQFK